MISFVYSLYIFIFNIHQALKYIFYIIFFKKIHKLLKKKSIIIDTMEGISIKSHTVTIDKLCLILRISHGRIYLYLSNYK